MGARGNGNETMISDLCEWFCVCVWCACVEENIEKYRKKISNSMNKKRIQIVGFLFNLFANKI